MKQSFIIFVCLLMMPVLPWFADAHISTPARLVAVTKRDQNGDGLNWTAGYDPLGRRVVTTYSSVSSNTPTLQYSSTSLPDPLHPMQEVLLITENGTPTTNIYLYGPDMSDTIGGLGGIGGLLAVKESNQVKQVVSDMFGNVLALVDTNGTAIWNPRYTNFRPTAAPTLNAPSFATRRYDPTGLIYMGARYYDPIIGRFTQPDPLRFVDSRNLYAYVGNNPINRVDPDGRISAQNMASIHMPQYGVSAQYGSYGTGNWQYQDNEENYKAAAFGAAMGTAALLTGGAVYEVAAPILAALPQSSGLFGAIHTAAQGSTAVRTTLAAGGAVFSAFGASQITAPPPSYMGPQGPGQFMHLGSVEQAPAPQTTAVSPYRVTGAGETFVRYESAQTAYSHITPSGVTPQTYAAPMSDGLVPLAQRSSVYNLPMPEIARPNVFTLRPPTGTPIIGPRPVLGGTGNEVLFPMGY